MTRNKTVAQSVIGLNCPSCRKGKLFKKRGLLVYSDMLEMNEDCPNCGFHYELEPGFWIGALWTSYPIVILLEVPFLFLALFADGAMVWVYFGAMILSFFIAWPLMLRLGRSIWIHVNVRKVEN